MPRIAIRYLDGPCNETNAIIVDGVRMTKEDIESLLAVLDPNKDPDMWHYVYRKYQALIAQGNKVFHDGKHFHMFCSYCGKRLEVEP